MSPEGIDPQERVYGDTYKPSDPIDQQLRKELKKDFEANLLDGDAIQDGGQMLSSHYVFEWVERAFPRYAALQADKAEQDLKDLVRDELAKQVQTGAIDMVSINIEQFVEAL